MAEDGHPSFFEEAFFPEHPPDPLLEALYSNHPEDYVFGSNWVSLEVSAEPHMPSQPATTGAFSGHQQSQQQLSAPTNLNSYTRTGTNKAGPDIPSSNMSGSRASNTISTSYSTSTAYNPTTLSRTSTASNPSTHFNVGPSRGPGATEPSTHDDLHYEADNNLTLKDDTSSAYGYSQMIPDNQFHVQINHDSYGESYIQDRRSESPEISFILTYPIATQSYLASSHLAPGNQEGLRLPSPNGQSPANSPLTSNAHKGASHNLLSDGFSDPLHPLNHVPVSLSANDHGGRQPTGRFHVDGSGSESTAAIQDGTSTDNGLGQSSADHIAPTPRMDDHIAGIGQGKQSGEDGESHAMDLDEPAIDNHGASEAVEESGIDDEEVEGDEKPAVPEPIVATVQCIKKKMVDGAKQRCTNMVWQPGTSKCLECLLNKVSERLEDLIASRHASGIWSCTGCYWAAVPTRQLCGNCREKSARMRENHRLRKIAEAEAEAAAAAAQAAEAAAAQDAAALAHQVHHAPQPQQPGPAVYAQGPYLIPPAYDGQFQQHNPQMPFSGVNLFQQQNQPVLFEQHNCFNNEPGNPNHSQV